MLEILEFIAMVLDGLYSLLQLVEVVGWIGEKLGQAGRFVVAHLPFGGS